MRPSHGRFRRARILLAAAAILLFRGTTPATASAGRTDFNGDGKADILWRHAATGANSIWILDGTTVVASGSLPAMSAPAWRIQATEDLTGDGKADVLWRHRDSGENLIWRMDGRRVAGQLRLPTLPDTDWQVGAVCDLDGDATADILFRHAAFGWNSLWRMSRGSPSGLAVPSNSDTGWGIVGCADFSGDGKADLLWRHAISGQNAVWLMNGATRVSQAVLAGRTDPAWRVAGTGDFDGDGKADVLWRHTGTGANEIVRMNGLAPAGGGPLPPLAPADWQVASVADFDRDARADLLWRNTSTGDNLVWFLEGATRRAVGPARALPDTGWMSSTSDASAAGPRLYLATLTPEGGAATPASGTSTLLLAADEKSALVTLRFSGLSSPQVAAHLHGPAGPGQSAPPVLSLPPGGFDDQLWIFSPAGGLTVADQVAALKTGRLYVNVHSATYPDGEIRGQLRMVPDSAPLPPPPKPPLPGPPAAEAAFRFLEQSTMGPTPSLVAHVQDVGYEAFLAEQFAEPPTPYLAFVQSAAVQGDTSRVNALRNRFFIAALHGRDQLRQRVALALSQILVVSTQGLYDGPGVAVYVDLLMKNAFGNYRTLLQDVTLNPAMGNYLDMVNNFKPSPSRGRAANENYAREVMQLFTIGLYQLHPNGSLKLDPAGRPIPTYDQAVIEGMARVFTGWTYAPLPGATPGPRNPKNYLAPMVLWPANHDTDPKSIVNGRVLPGGQSGEADLRAALDALFQHPNLGPFMGRQLIQHLVTSNPSPGYVARVARAFADNGSRVRGDMKAVIRAVLLDPEARREPTLDFGRPREPLLLVTGLLRKLGATGDGWGLTGAAGNMGQRPFGPPTVFGFYVPDYQVPGSTLFGPPLEIYTESTAIRRSNLVYSLVFGTIGPPPYAPPGASSIAIDLDPWIALEGNPSALVDALDLRLTGGTLSGEVRSAVIQAVAATRASSTSMRAKTAIYLVATSPQYNVQR